MNIPVAIIMFAFLIVLFLIGIFAKRWVSNSEDFLVAHKGISPWMNIFGVFALGFAGTSLALSPAYMLRYGFIGSFAMNFAVSFIGAAMYGFLIGGFARTTGTTTMTEWLEMRFSSRVRTILACSSLLALIGVTAYNVLALANVISGFFGWDLYITVAIAVLSFLLFTFFSGMWGVTLTDFVQACIGVVGTPLLIFFCVKTFGGFAENAAGWGGGQFNWLTQGITGMTMPVFKVTLPSWLTVITFFGIFLIWASQYYWLRAAAVRTAKGARWSFLVGGIIGTVVSLCITITALFSGSKFGELFTLNGGALPPEGSYGFTISHFGMVPGAFLMMFALAASLSTASTAILGAIAVAVNDIYVRSFKPDLNKDPKKKLRVTRIVTIMVGALVWLLAYYPSGTQYLFTFATSWSGPLAVLAILGIFWRRLTAKAAMWSAVCGISTMTIWTLLDLLGVPVMTIMHTGILGAITCGVPAVLGSFLTKPNYYGEKGWKLEGKAACTEDITLEESDLKILQHIRDGFAVMAEIVDVMDMPSHVLNKNIEKLDKYGYIARVGLRGIKFFTFYILEKGRRAISAPEVKEMELLEKYKITHTDYKMLQEIKAAGKVHAGDFARSFSGDAQYNIVCVHKLLRLGYIRESGFTQMRLSPTRKGLALQQ